MEHFLYWHIFLCVRTNIWLEAYSYLHYDLHISSLQENLNVLLIPFYSHIIRKQTKKCYDWICSQDTTRLEFLKLSIFKRLVELSFVPASVVLLPLRINYNNRQQCLLARTNSQLIFHSMLKGIIFIWLREGS